MQNKNDRGMIKWQPFAALKEHEEAIKKLTAERKKINKPTLSADQLEQLNILISEAYIKKKKLELKIFKYGNFELISGTIERINDITRIMTIHTNTSFIKIKWDSIIDANLLE